MAAVRDAYGDMLKEAQSKPLVRLPAPSVAMTTPAVYVYSDLPLREPKHGQQNISHVIEIIEDVVEHFDFERIKELAMTGSLDELPAPLTVKAPTDKTVDLQLAAVPGAGNNKTTIV